MKMQQNPPQLPRGNQIDVPANLPVTPQLKTQKVDFRTTAYGMRAIDIPETFDNPLKRQISVN